MYKGHSVWDKEQEDEHFVIHKNKHGADYHGHADYNSGSSGSSDVYNSAKAEEDGKRKEASGVEKEVEEEIKKSQKEEEASDEQVKAKAASEVHQETKEPDDKKDKKAHKSIEDAINKAMKAEKEVIYLQR